MSNTPNSDEDVGTTGHEWDGIEELNNPLPRWWLWTFYGTVVWGLLYSFAYPAWPLFEQASSGIFGYSTRGEVEAEIAAVAEANAVLDDALAAVELTALRDDPALYSYAVQGGAAVFRTYCSQCHGQGAAGVQASGYPNLLDDDWLWGGTIDAIAYTVAHGIRNEQSLDARYSEMPAFAEVLEEEEIDALVAYVRNLSGLEADASLLELGGDLYYDNCAACHGDNGLGEPELGAPNLTDAIWLYGGSEEKIRETILYSRYGVMPAWNERLSEAEINAVAAYVHQLGGGE